MYLGKAGKNKEPLYRSLLSAAYDKPRNAAANISDNDAIFVPSGWDNPNKINVLTDSFQNIKVDDAYADQIKDQSSSFGGNTAANVEAEDVQEFLKKQQPLLGAKVKEAPESGGERVGGSKPTPAVAANPVRTRVTSAGGTGAKPAVRSTPARASTPGKTPSKTGAKPGAKGDGQNQDVLAEYAPPLPSPFSSLFLSAAALALIHRTTCPHTFVYRGCVRFWLQLFQLFAAKEGRGWRLDEVTPTGIIVSGRSPPPFGWPLPHVFV